MYEQEKTNGSARFFLLMLVFACTAVTAFSLGDMLPTVRYLLTPAGAASGSYLARYLPVGAESVSRISAVLTGAALEMGIWFLAGLGIWAGAVFMLAAACRGACFGFVLSLITGNSTADLAGWNPAVLTGWLAMTVLLFCLGAGQSVPKNGRQFFRWTMRFSVFAGASFWIIILCERMHAVF